MLMVMGSAITLIILMPNIREMELEKRMVLAKVLE